MKVQRISKIENDGTRTISWLLLDNDYLPIEPVSEFLRYLDIISCSFNTVRSYCCHLKLFFTFLGETKTDWERVGNSDLTKFITWLQYPPLASNVVRFEQNSSKPERAASTVNAIVAAVISFYQYQERLGRVSALNVHKWQHSFGSPRYKKFLHGITRNESVKRNVYKLQIPEKHPKVLAAEDARKLISVCQRKRDKFLVSLLYETGMRIGQALGLRHADIGSYNNEITIVPRQDNVNQARPKTYEPYVVHVSKELMRLYGDYLVEEFGETDSDYVFVNLWGEPRGRPFSYPAAKDLFNRLSKKTGVVVSPHYYRHTHATDLIRDKWDMAYVQKRLGHRNIQTTINIYAHVSAEDLKIVYQEYLSRR